MSLVTFLFQLPLMVTGKPLAIDKIDAALSSCVDFYLYAALRCWM